MTKAELIERIARSKNLPPDFTKRDIALVLGLAFEELSVYFAKAKVTKSNAPKFTFPRFGTFTKKKRSARMGVNPRTLEPMQIEASHTVDFRASRELRDAMNRESMGQGKSGKPMASPEGEVRPAPKPKSKPSKGKRSARKAAASEGELSLGRRRLTPRDEDAELDAMIGDDIMFDEAATLPAAPLHRVRPRKAESGENAETRARTG